MSQQSFNDKSKAEIGCGAERKVEGFYELLCICDK